jgi:hypothetical protein
MSPTGGINCVEDSVERQLIRREGFNDSPSVGWYGRQDRVEFGSTFDKFFGCAAAQHHRRDFCLLVEPGTGDGESLDRLLGAIRASQSGWLADVVDCSRTTVVPGNNCGEIATSSSAA